VNVLVTEGENEYVLEVNTLPGHDPTSLLPKIAAGAGHRLPRPLRGDPPRRAAAQPRRRDRSVAREAERRRRPSRLGDA
jgi:D-alanine-D-alanine ligase